MDHAEVISASKSDLVEVTSRVLTLVRDSWIIIKRYITDSNGHF